LGKGSCGNWLLLLIKIHRTFGPSFSIKLSDQVKNYRTFASVRRNLGITVIHKTCIVHQRVSVWTRLNWTYYFWFKIGTRFYFAMRSPIPSDGTTHAATWTVSVRVSSSCSFITWYSFSIVSQIYEKLTSSMSEEKIIKIIEINSPSIPSLLKVSYLTTYFHRIVTSQCHLNRQTSRLGCPTTGFLEAYREMTKLAKTVDRNISLQFVQ